MAGRILYNNLLRSATVLSDTTATGFGPSNSLDGRTSTFSKMAAGTDQNIVYDFGSAKSFDSFALARHNFGANTYITVQGSADNITYTNIITSVNVIYDKNIFKDLGSQSYRYVKILWTDTSQEMVFADVFIGPSLELQRSQLHGFTRPGLSDGDSVIANVTRGKELAGLTIRPNPERVRFTMPYYTSAWLSEFISLRDTMKEYPIYMIWDITRSETPFTGGEPAFYCWPTKSLPAPKYSKNINGYYDVRFDMTGFYK